MNDYSAIKPRRAIVNLIINQNPASPLGLFSTCALLHLCTSPLVNFPTCQSATSSDLVFVLLNDGVMLRCWLTGLGDLII
ncbi:hypothetical protein BD777DRAFT_123668 [Yarrowia lipolytica]|nr:hypothetical protein BD777DRAFT_123668 [Yarrowia lipolytica]